MATITKTPPEYVLADLLAVVASKAANAGADAALLAGDPEFLRHQGRIEMAREIAVVIEARIADLTAGA